MIRASVDLSGLHMASDRDLNRKSFTTGPMGFGVPFAIMLDRSDVPRNAARVLRYMDAFYTVTQGEVFYVTELLARLERLERGPAGNVSLAVAIFLARTMKEDQISYGNPRSSLANKSIVLPKTYDQLQAKEESMDALRKKYLKSIGVKKI